MSWLHTVTQVLHMLFALGIVGLVLLQRGKGAEAGAGFGAGASGTVFGARGSGSFLSHTTAVLAALFFITSLSLAYLGGKQPAAQTSVMDQLQTTPQTTTNSPEVSPAKPETPLAKKDDVSPAPATPVEPAKN